MTIRGFCHSEEANQELYCSAQSNRLTKNLTFPSALSVFLPLQGKLIFRAGLKRRFFGRLGFRSISLTFIFIDFDML
jgi:hypothetical protein